LEIQARLEFCAAETAVCALYQQLMDGWNKGSGTELAVVFAEDGDLIGFDGTQVTMKSRRQQPNSSC